MSNNKLNLRIKGMLAAVVMTGFLTACNNDSETANNSTVVDSTVITPSTETATVPAPVKKKGKTSVSMESDDVTVKMEKDKMGYYNRTEMAAAYPGGQNSLEQYVTNNIEYPQDAIDNNTEGIVYVKFGVDENGSISNVSTVGQKLGNGLEDEAIKVVSKMPKWRPGQIKGKNVKTWRTLPIIYKLES